jgi:hypothetical protein
MSTILWKKYSGPEKIRFFAMSSGPIPFLAGEKQSEAAGIILRFSGPDYCFYFPSIFGAFLRETVIFQSFLSGRGGISSVRKNWCH